MIERPAHETFGPTLGVARFQVWLMVVLTALPVGALGAQLPDSPAAATPPAEQNAAPANAATPATTVDAVPAESSAAAPTAVPSGAEGAAPAEAPAAGNTSTSPATAANSGASPTAAADAPAEVVAASLQGIQPGRSTQQDVQKVWGMPKGLERVQHQTEHVYHLPPFPKVTVSYDGEVVSGLVLYLPQAVSNKAARRQLGLEAFESVVVYNEAGEALGEAFPERGVLFSYEPGQVTPQVAQVLLQPIHADPFLLRAQQQQAVRPQAALADVAHALRCDPRQAQAYGIKAQILSAVGRHTEALQAADVACQLAPDRADLALTRAAILEKKGQYEAALAVTKRALASADLTPELQARGLCQLADHLALGPWHDYRQSVERREEAIALLQELTQKSPGRPAGSWEQLLLDAHLGMAHDIAWGPYQRKSEVVPRWLAQANALVKQGEQAGSSNRPGRFLLSRRALSALVGMHGTMDPGPWVESTWETGQELIEQSVDPWHRRQLEWELGLALYDALQVYHARSEGDSALWCGQQAAKLMEATLADSDDAQGPRYLLGRVYFRLGAVYAVIQQKHDAAIPWFEKAAPLLRAAEVDSPVDLGRKGESLVSMAVSYWETGRQGEAVELTRQGQQMMERAVQEAALPATALSVPYANLARMHMSLGDRNSAEKFHEMATRAKTTATR